MADTPQAPRAGEGVGREVTIAFESTTAHEFLVKLAMRALYERAGIVGTHTRAECERIVGESLARIGGPAVFARWMADASPAPHGAGAAEGDGLARLCAEVQRAERIAQASRVLLAHALGEGETPQPGEVLQQGVAFDAVDLWRAYEAGAREGRDHQPDDALVSRSADAYVKLAHIEKPRSAALTYPTDDVRAGAAEGVTEAERRTKADWRYNYLHASPETRRTAEKLATDTATAMARVESVLTMTDERGCAGAWLENASLLAIRRVLEALRAAPPADDLTTLRAETARLAAALRERENERDAARAKAVRATELLGRAVLRQEAAERRAELMRRAVNVLDVTPTKVQHLRDLAEVCRSQSLRRDGMCADASVRAAWSVRHRTLEQHVIPAMELLSDLRVARAALDAARTEGGR